MLAGQPLGATAGVGTKADVVTAFSMDLNGNATTVSNKIWGKDEMHVPMGADGKPTSIKADALKPVVQSYKIRANHSTWAWCSLFLLTTTSCATGWLPVV